MGTPSRNLSSKPATIPPEVGNQNRRRSKRAQVDKHLQNHSGVEGRVLAMFQIVERVHATKVDRGAACNERPQDGLRASARAIDRTPGRCERQPCISYRERALKVQVEGVAARLHDTRCKEKDPVSSDPCDGEPEPRDHHGQPGGRLFPCACQEFQCRRKGLQLLALRRRTSRHQSTSDYLRHHPFFKRQFRYLPVARDAIQLLKCCCRSSG